ncbi:MAG: protein kinase [Chloroflexota bacterium]|jgi:WD40 repeat protein/serine/threonine protein kinase/DNA-binding SARP family transcriptional activator
MARLSVRLLGPFEVTLGAKLVTDFESDKVRALLAYLIVEADRPHSRETLAEFLWPNRPPGAGLSNLRHALAILRQAIADNQAAPHFLNVSRQSLQFNIAADARIDFFDFRQKAAQVPEGQAGQQALEEAVALVRGSFLEGLSVGDSAALEEWILFKRELIDGELMQALNRLASYAELTGEFELALRYLRRQVELTPWEEQAYRQLMRLLALSGRRGEALAQFEIAHDRLNEELSVDPSPETVALYKRIKGGELKPSLSELYREHIRGYELGECIGTGHVGAVYRAYQPIIARNVAIKIIRPQFASRPDFIRRFETEARTVARLEHPHIVPLFDFWREPKGAYLVMRWLRGGNLQDELAAGPWPVEPCARLVEQISAALTVAHHQGVVHRDVKPANILLDDAGNAYLSDFGIATMIETAEANEPPKPDYITGSLGYLSPEAARGSVVTPVTDVYSLGVVIYQLLTGRHPFPDLSPQALIQKHLSDPLPNVGALRPELPPAVDEVIQQATAKAPKDRFEDALSLARAFRQALGFSRRPPPILAQEIEDQPNPYRGLHAFQEEDAPYFFGREGLIGRLVSRLSETSEGARLLAVVGPSGSGKTSVIKAGLLPALRNGAVPGSEKWYVVDQSPGIHPLEEMALGLLGIAAEEPLDDLKTTLDDDEYGLQKAVDLILPDGHSELLLIIDQFETLFDNAVCRNERQQLLAQIYAAVIDPESRLRVIIGLRADFYDRPLANPGFSHLMGQRTETVGPLTAEQLVLAIEGPAKQVGVELEPGLTARIVAEVNEQPGALPMLQFTLTELYERRWGHWLQKQSYQAIGGLSGALVKRAESLYHDLDPEEQKTIRQLFLRLISLGEEAPEVSPAPITKRRVLRSELESLYQSQDSPGSRSIEPWEDSAQSISATEKIVNLFGSARLLTFDREPSTREPTVEIAHEALLWEWPRLRAWVDESRDNLRVQRLLAHEASEWLVAGEEPSFLLRGARLDQFEHWARTTDLALTEVEQRYLDISLGKRTARHEAEAARLAHEATLERRSRNFVKVLAGVLAAATVVALLLMIYAFSQQRQALKAYSLSLTANAQQAVQNKDSATALLLALTANQIASPPLEAQRTLLDAAYAPGSRHRYEVTSLFPGIQGPATSLAISPDGRTALIGFADGPVVLWDWETGAEIRRLNGHTDAINDLAFAPDGRTAVSTADDALVIQWDIETGHSIRQLAGHAGPVQTVAISADGQQVVSGGYGSDSFSDPGQLILWDLAEGREIRRFSSHKAGVIQAHFALSDTVIVASSGDAELLTDLGTDSPAQELQVETILWGTASGEIVARLTSFGHDAYSMAISPNGQQALIGSYYDNVASVVDLLTGDTIQVFEGHRDAVSAVHFGADNRQAVTGSHDGSLALWDLTSGEMVAQLKVHRDEITAVAVTPDGRSALSTSRNGELIRWDLFDAMDMGHYLGHGDMVYDVAYLPGGKRFLSISGGSSPAVSSRDTSVRLWDVSSRKQIRARELPLEVLFQVDVTPDGQTALIAGIVPTVMMLDAETLADVGRLEGHDGWVTAVDISPDGRQAVTASVDGSLILWDLVNKQLVRQIETGASGGLWAVAISPDGRTALADTEDGVMGLWDLETGDQLANFALEGMTGQQGASGIAFLPDGRSAIAQGNNGVIYHWDLQSGELIRILGQHNDIRARIEIAPDGRLALSSGMDGVLMLWDLNSGELIRRFGRPGQNIFDVDMSPDGQTALSGSSDTSIVLWHLDNPSLSELKEWIAANRFVREPTCVERDLYQIQPYCSTGE